MLGSVAEAEDMVQETFLRWQRQSAEEIRSAKAWLTSTITRLCIDHLRSARVRREEYVGVWLPEPLLEKPEKHHDKNMALADSLSTAFLVLLETLSPTERAVFLLREVFEYDYPEISQIIGKSEANCRQMVRRAKDHISARRPRFPADPIHGDRLVGKFLDTCRMGDTAGLLSLLSEEAVLYSDGGGKVVAAPRPIAGAAKVARFLVGVSKVVPAGTEHCFAMINGAPGFLRMLNGQLVQTTTLEIVNGRIEAIYIVRNPEKLKHVRMTNDE